MTVTTPKPSTSRCACKKSTGIKSWQAKFPESLCEIPLFQGGEEDVLNCKGRVPLVSVLLFFLLFFLSSVFLFVFLQKLETDKAKMPIRSLKWLIYLIFYTFQKNRDLSHCPMLFLHPSHVFLALKHESKQIKNNFV